MGELNVHPSFSLSNSSFSFYFQIPNLCMIPGLLLIEYFWQLQAIADFGDIDDEIFHGWQWIGSRAHITHYGGYNLMTKRGWWPFFSFSLQPSTSMDHTN
jgi:hypothetical protein